MENEPDVAVSKIVSPSTSRNFFLTTTFFQNGCFVVITEDQPRIGAVSIAISTSNKISTAKVIPSKYDSIFISTVAEKVSSMINGISLVSLHSKNQLQFDDMKAIMEEVTNTVGNKRYEKQ
ncbi:MAG: hypothetical protein M3286_03200 [Thermoproteota archaeon]|jgi:hypothetical protein|nr:hypothetical protein [Thermoproteota archaeon]